MGRARRRVGPAGNRSHLAFLHVGLVEEMPQKTKKKKKKQKAKKEKSKSVIIDSRRPEIIDTYTVSREQPHRSNSSTDCSLSHYYYSSLISPRTYRTYRRPMRDHRHVTSYSHTSRSVSAHQKWKWKWRKKGRGRGLCWRRGGTSSCSLPNPNVR